MKKKIDELILNIQMGNGREELIGNREKNPSANIELCLYTL